MLGKCKGTINGQLKIYQGKKTDLMETTKFGGKKMLK